MIYQIQDENGIIFRDYEFHEISLAWDINYLNDEVFEKKYNTTIRDPKWKIEKFKGKLQLVAILEEIEVNPTYKTKTDEEEIDKLTEKVYSDALKNPKLMADITRLLEKREKRIQAPK